MSRGSTVRGYIDLLDLDEVNSRHFLVWVYASDDVGELLRDTAEDVRVKAYAKTLYGTIIDPDSWVSPPDTPMKELTGFHVKEIIRVG